MSFLFFKEIESRCPQQIKYLFFFFYIILNALNNLKTWKKIFFTKTFFSGLKSLRWILKLCPLKSQVAPVCPHPPLRSTLNFGTHNDCSMRLLYSASAAHPQAWSRVFWSSLSSSLSVFPVEKGRSSLLLWWVVYNVLSVCSIILTLLSAAVLTNPFGLKNFHEMTHILTLCYVSYIYALQLCVLCKCELSLCFLFDFIHSRCFALIILYRQWYQSSLKRYPAVTTLEWQYLLTWVTIVCYQLWFWLYNLFSR